MNLGLQYFYEKAPDFVCVVDPDGREWSRREFVEFVNRLARALETAGFGEGDTVAVISRNCAEYLLVYFAAIHAGLSVVPINWHLSPAEIAFILEDSCADVVVVHHALSKKLLLSVRENAPSSLQLFSIGDIVGYRSIESLAKLESSRPPDRPACGRLMAYTSATTGKPKAVLTPSGDPLALLRRRIEANHVVGVYPEDDNVNLCASMLYHSAPLGGCEVALTMGHRVILVDLWGPELLLRLIDKYGVTTTFLSPSMFVRLLKLPKSVRDQYSVSSLRFVAHGGAPCSETVKRRMLDWWGPIIWEAYGATEAQGTVASPEEWLKYPGTVGKPLPGSAIKILDDDGAELPANTVGLIYIRPNSGQIFEYKGDPEKTRSSVSGDFVTVGDMGYVNDNGYLFVCDRRDDLIISSGMNIYPAEIEACLIEHPSVRDCAVIGVPHALLGSVPNAYIEVEPGVERGRDLTISILRFVCERLSAMKAPKRVVYVDSIPRDPSGKLFKRSLSAMHTEAPDQGTLA